MYCFVFYVKICVSAQDRYILILSNHHRSIIEQPINHASHNVYKLKQYEGVSDRRGILKDSQVFSSRSCDLWLAAFQQNGETGRLADAPKRITGNMIDLETGSVHD